MKLSEVLTEVDVIEISGSEDTEIAGIACDSRRVQDGFLFVAIRGQKADGHSFVGEAVSRGARAVMCEPPAPPVDIATRIIVSGTRRALAQAAATFHANPSRSLGLVGITGTNGKTTTCHLVRNLLEEGGFKAGMIGTIEYRIADESVPADRTTPDPLLLNSLIARMMIRGCHYVVMEVSSHSLDQDRVAMLDFDVAVFTNLTRDHLDYHKTMRNYLRAKASLFKSLSPHQKDGFKGTPSGMVSPVAVICTDQPAGRYIVRRTAAPVLTYGFSADADVVPEDIHLGTPSGMVSPTSFVARTPWGRIAIESRLIGRHNVSNILAAVAVGLSQGVDKEAIQRAVSATPRVPGRLEFICGDTIRNGVPFRGYNVVVDYAHTDDALTNVLGTLREITKGRLIVAFGCGGDRDKGKRRNMGRVASALADFAVVTSDNPRSEDPMEIIAEIVRGFQKDGADFVIEPDRREAIARALFMAREGDTVLLAGKGHETYQEFKDHRIDFDDRKVARELLARISGAGVSPAYSSRAKRGNAGVTPALRTL